MKDKTTELLESQIGMPVTYELKEGRLVETMKCRVCGEGESTVGECLLLRHDDWTTMGGARSLILIKYFHKGSFEIESAIQIEETDSSDKVELWFKDLDNRIALVGDFETATLAKVAAEQLIETFREFQVQRRKFETGDEITAENFDEFLPVEDETFSAEMEDIISVHLVHDITDSFCDQYPVIGVDKTGKYLELSSSYGWKNELTGEFEENTILVKKAMVD